MKVLHIITGLGQGGAERQLANLVSINPGEVFVFSLKVPGVMAEGIWRAGVPIYTGDVRRSVSPGWITRLRGAILELRPDLVMGWMYHGNLAASLTRWLGHRGVIVWNVRHSVHDMSREKASTRWIIRSGAWLSGSPARIVYNSATAAKQHEGIGYPSDKRVILPNGFDLERFKPDLEVRVTRRASFGIPPNRFLLGVLGRAHPMKNHLGWLKAFRMLVDQGLPVHCVMCGTGVADREGSVATAVWEMGLESNITLLPPTDSPESLYPALDLLVMPSLWGEGFPNVVGEAMSCGVSCVATDVGDSAFIVGDTGVIVAPRDTDVLANAIIGFLSKTPDERAALGTAARRRIEERYSLRRVVDQYANLYRNFERLKS